MSRNQADSDEKPDLVTDRRLIVAIALASFGILTTEIALTRVFSFAISYHFAYLTIATAMLGFGSAGAILSVRPGLFGAPARRLAWSGGLAAITTVVALAYASVVRFNPQQVTSDPSAAAVLFSYYAVVAVPFVFSGLFVATILWLRAEKVGQLYAADLVGAGVGCALSVAMIWWLQTPAAVVVGACALALAACLTATGRPTLQLAGGSAVFTVLLGALVVAFGPFPPAPGKFLSLFLASPDCIPLYHRWTPLSRVDAVGWRKTKDSWKASYAVSGVSPTYDGEGPEFRMIGYDGGSFAVMYEWDGEPGSIEVFRHHLMAAPYRLMREPETLIIGLGGGADALAGLANGVGRMTAVELNPVTVELGTGRFHEFNGGLFLRPDLEVIAAEGRHWLEANGQRYDLIVLNSIDTLSALSTGAYVLAESYLYTEEAFGSYLDHLERDGMFALYSYDNFGVAAPTYIISRFAATFAEALRERGIEDPQTNMAIMAGPGSTPLVATLVKPDGFSRRELDALDRFVQEQGFSFWHRPGSTLAHPVSVLLRSSPVEFAETISKHYLRLDPATDGSPFFFNFYKWKTLVFGHPDDPGTTPATGQRMLIVMLVQAAAIAVVMILGPLWFLSRDLPVRSSAGYVIYFASLGFGFILLEISLLQRFVLFLGFPTYSLSVVLFSLLTFTGVGSALSSRIRASEHSAAVAVVGMLVVLAVGVDRLLPTVFSMFLDAALPWRILVTVAVFAPLGSLLGMLFPLGIRIVQRTNPRFVPWAWGVNGCTSVVGTIAAVMLAMAYGFSLVIHVALATYVAGALALAWSQRAKMAS